MGVKARVIVTPFTMLPTESARKTEKEIEAEKEFIREHIIGKNNETISKNQAASRLISELGGDLQINAFAVNFEIDGKLNEDVVSEAPTGGRAKTMIQEDAHLPALLLCWLLAALT